MSIIKPVTLQKIVAHDFRYDPRSCNCKISNTNGSFPPERWVYGIYCCNHCLASPAGVVMQLGLISFCQDSGRYSGVDNVVVICYVFGEYTALAGQTTTENPISQNSIRTHKTQQHIRPTCFNLEYIDYRS